MVRIAVTRQAYSATARLLAAALAERRGVEVVARADADVLVNWGGDASGWTKPALNRTLPANKLAELRTLHEAGVPAITASNFEGARGLRMPVLRRSLKHKGGTDIRGPFQRPERVRFDARRHFWTQVVEVRREWRVWCWRDEKLAAYEKVQRDANTGPARFGRNWRNGWRFEFRQDAPSEVVRVATAATQALGLAFAGVDVAETPEGALVLEVNTAPGVEGSRVCLRKLARRIARWAKEATA